MTFRHVLSDIETLNRKAMEGVYDLSAISYHAYPYVADKYVADGQRIERRRWLRPDGRRDPARWSPKRSKARRSPFPGTLTTAYLALKIFEPDFETGDRAVRQDSRNRHRSGGADAGLIIHEAQLTYNKTGFHRVLDMGKWWKDKFGLPLPLGGNVLLRSLPDDVKSECCRMMRDSIQYALDNHAEALEYAMQFARDMEPRAGREVRRHVRQPLHGGCRRGYPEGCPDAARHGPSKRA